MIERLPLWVEATAGLNIESHHIFNFGESKRLSRKSQPLQYLMCGFGVLFVDIAEDSGVSFF